MFNVGGGELLVILAIALLVLGPSRLPQAARQVGEFIGEFRRVAAGFQTELKTAFEQEEAAAKPRSAGGPTDQRVIDAEAKETGPADGASDP